MEARRLLRDLRDTVLAQFDRLRPERPGEGREPTALALLHRARAGDRRGVRRLLRAGRGGLAARAGLAPMFAAAEGGHWAVARTLIGYTELEARYGGGDTALIAAASAGDAGLVGLLVEAGAKFDAVNDHGATALMATVLNGDTNTLRALIELGAPLGRAEPTRHSALLEAAHRGLREAVEVLLEAGADPDFGGLRGEAPLAAALEAGYSGIATALIAHGADLSTANDGVPLLETAAARGMADVVAGLLNRGAPSCDAQIIGTALRAAVREGASAAVSLLAPVAERLDTVDEAGSTLLMLAAEAGDIVSVRALAEAGADVNQRVAECSALLGAAERGDVSTLVSLVELGADLAAEQPPGVTPLLSRAVTGGHLRAVEILVRGGAPLNTCDRFGATPLMVAVERRDERIAALLIESGADPDLATNSGQSPLHRATRLGDAAMVKRLLAAGAHCDTRDNMGRNLIDIAHKSGYDDVVAELRKAASATDFGYRPMGGFD